MTQTKFITKNVAPLATRNALRRFTLALNVRRITCDSNGVIIPDGVVPAAEQKAFPFHLFGAFDYASGYPLADTIARERSNSNLFTVYVHGIGTPLFYFNPLATINNQIKKGDLVFVYVDDLNNPNTFSYVIVSALQGGFASLILQSNISQIDDNGHWGAFKFFEIGYAWQNDEQLNQPIYLVRSRFDSGYKYDTLDPLAFRYVQQKNDLNVISIPLEIVLNQYIGITSFIAFENSVLNLSFNLYI